MPSMLILSPWCGQHEIESNKLDLVRNLMRGSFIPIQSKDVLSAKCIPSSMPLSTTVYRDPHRTSRYDDVHASRFEPWKQLQSILVVSRARSSSQDACMHLFILLIRV